MGQNIMKKILDAEAKNRLTQEEKEELVCELWNILRVARETPYLLYPLTASDIERTYVRLKGLWLINAEGYRIDTPTEA